MKDAPIARMRSIFATAQSLFAWQQQAMGKSQPGEHQRLHGKEDECFGRSTASLTIAGEATTPGHPGGGAFHDPPSGEDREACGRDRVSVDVGSFGSPDAPPSCPRVRDDRDLTSQVCFDSCPACATTMAIVTGVSGITGVSRSGNHRERRSGVVGLVVGCLSALLVIGAGFALLIVGFWTA